MFSYELQVAVVCQAVRPAFKLIRQVKSHLTTISKRVEKLHADPIFELLDFKNVFTNACNVFKFDNQKLAIDLACSS